jgi:hypothetical protein
VIYKIIKLSETGEDLLIAEINDVKANRITYFSMKTKGSTIRAVVVVVSVNFMNVVLFFSLADYGHGVKF